jgi:hydroxypyruvate reductase
VEAAMASIGTDGIDGPTDAAGALADSTTAARARERSLDPEAYLADNNAYAFFAALDDLIITGPTATNVGDVQLILFP